MEASENGETATVEILLEAGAALDAESKVRLLLRTLELSRDVNFVSA